MDQLQHPLAFVHKFNLYKLAGLLIEDGRLTYFDSLDDAIAAHEANLARAPILAPGPIPAA